MENSKIRGGTSRREFMQQLALCYVAAHIPLSFLGCKDDQPTFVGSGKAPYKVWEEMLMALKTSPDHLEGRMNALIESKDAEAMFHFVRDEIYLMPTHKTYLQNLGTQLKWGLKGVLRSGFATPREKAELLNKMYQAAGMESKVVYERTDIKTEDVPAYFFRPIQRHFGLDISKQQWKQWKNELEVKGDSEYEIPVYDEGFNESTDLAEKLWELLPEKETLNKYPFDFRWDNYRTPTVEFILNGETKFAHLFDPNVAFGALKNDNGGKTSKADPVLDNEEKVSISISYRDSIEPTVERELVFGDWFATQLIGNQINLSFLNGLSLEQQAFTPIGSLRTFTPALAFQSFDEELQVMEDNSFLGNPFTLDAKVFDVSGEEPKINGSTLLKKPNIDLQKKVTALKIKAVPAHYPLVKLHVTPTDDHGDFVEGLSTSDFAITDNEIQVSALMESNRQTPRILILYDTSLSMPKAYYEENMDTFINALDQSILEKYPASFITKWKTPSELFTWLLKASKTDYDLIIYATDGDNDDSYDETNAEIYKNGAPAIILNVNDEEGRHKVETFAKMADITNGMVLNAKDQEKTQEAIMDYISKMEIPPYVFTYYAVGATEEHEAKVGIDAHRIMERDRFKFIDDKKEIGQCLIGLYCTINVGKSTIKRVLAGWDPVTQRNVKPDYSHFIAVKNTILGGATVYIEGEGPTVSAALSDVLKYRLTTREWGEALMEDDLERAKEHFSKGGYIYHPEIVPLMAPLENAVTKSSMTFAAGIRMAIIKHRIGVGESTSTTSFDYLPSSNYTTIAEASESAFKMTLQKTAQFAIREGHFYPTNTLSELKDLKLIERQKAIDDKWFQEKRDAFTNPYYWNERIYRGDGNFKIFDAAAVSMAFWQIDQKTGELLGILADGTGGGSNSIEEQLKELNRVIDMYMAIFSAMGVSNLAIGIVATYGKTLVKLYAIVTEVIIIMDPTGMDEKVMAALQELACNVNKEIMFFALGAVGEVFGNIDLLISLMGGSGLPGTACG